RDAACDVGVVPEPVPVWRRDAGVPAPLRECRVHPGGVAGGHRNSLTTDPPASLLHDARVLAHHSGLLPPPWLVAPHPPLLHHAWLCTHHAWASPSRLALHPSRLASRPSRPVSRPSPPASPSLLALRSSRQASASLRAYPSRPASPSRPVFPSHPVFPS